MKNFLSKLKSISEKAEKSTLSYAIFSSFMAVTPVTIGIVIFSIVIGISISGWQDLLKESGIYDCLYAIVNTVTNFSALYISFTLAYFYAQKKEKNGIVAGLVSLCSFLAMIPLESVELSGKTVKVIDTSYFSADGYFAAMLIAYLTAKLFVLLEDVRFLKIKMSDRIPKQVSSALSSSLVVIILFAVTFVIQLIFHFTSFGTLFGFISFLTSPIMNIGTAPMALILVEALGNLLWFFSIHPSIIKKPYQVVLKVAAAANVLAYLNGEGMPYLTLSIMSMCTVLGGSGGTLGLSLDSLFFSKSDKYKSLGKATIVTSLCNINEPVMFGYPVIYNYIYLAPLILTPTVCGLLSWGICETGFLNLFNPTVAMPWTIPYPVSALLKGGWQLMVVVLACVLVEMLIYFPFFKIADRRELKQASSQEETQKEPSVSD